MNELIDHAEYFFMKNLHEGAGLVSTFDYYTSDLTELPYSEILSGRNGTWSYFIRFFVLLRKIIGWHFEALNGRAFPCQGKQLDFDNLPSSLREGLSHFIHEANELGFKLVCVVKEDTIGNYASYRCLLVSPDRRTTISLGAIRLATKYNSAVKWIVGLRSDTVHGKIHLTTRTACL